MSLYIVWRPRCCSQFRRCRTALCMPFLCPASRHIRLKVLCKVRSTGKGKGGLSEWQMLSLKTHAEHLDTSVLFSPAFSRRLPMVPVLSSEAKMPFPGSVKRHATSRRWSIPSSAPNLCHLESLCTGMMTRVQRVRCSKGSPWTTYDDSSP